MLEGVIFDWDGVISDSFKDQFRWFSHCCAELGKAFPYQTLEEFRGCYEEPVYPVMYEKLGFDWKKEKDEVWRLYKEHKADAGNIPLISGMPAILTELKSLGVRLGIASSNIENVIKDGLLMNGLDNLFDTIVSKEDLPVLSSGEPKLKPYPDSIHICLNRMGLLPGDALYVGDQPSDAEACERLKELAGSPIAMFGVTFGYSTQERLLKYLPKNQIMDSPDGLLRAISLLLS